MNLLTDAQRDRAADYLEKAWDAEKPALRSKWARKALEIDPDGLDAYLILSQGDITTAERIALLSEAVRRGKTIWAGEIKRPAQSYFWLDIDTRPFMRCLHVLALTQWETGDAKSAIENAKLLHRINPNDNQGIRYLLMAWYPVTENWDAFTKLLAKCKDEGRTEYLYSACLNAFRMGAETDSLLAEALNANPFVPAFLVNGRKQPADDDDSPFAGYVAMGSEGEAHGFAEFNRAAWDKVPGAIEWLWKATESRP